MSNITLGDGGTVKSLTPEGHLLEIMMLLQLQEQDVLKNSSGKDYIQGSYNTNTKLFNGSFSLPVTQALNSTGQLTISVPDYLQDVVFLPGTGGTFKSTNIAAYFLEVLMYCQLLENDLEKNPQKKNNITGNFNSDNTLFSGSVTLPIQVSVAVDGTQIVEAVPYLL